MSDKYKYSPTNDEEVQKMEMIKKRYKKIGWSFDEIPDPDGSGDIWVVFTPPTGNADVNSTAL